MGFKCLNLPHISQLNWLAQKDCFFLLFNLWKGLWQWKGCFLLLKSEKWPSRPGFWFKYGKIQSKWRRVERLQLSYFRDFTSKNIPIAHTRALRAWAQTWYLQKKYCFGGQKINITKLKKHYLHDGDWSSIHRKNHLEISRVQSKHKDFVLVILLCRVYYRIILLQFWAATRNYDIHAFVSMIFC